MMGKILNNNTGLSLIEALISMVLLIIGILSAVSLQTTFAVQTFDRTLLNALIDSAGNALNECQINSAMSLSKSYTYEGTTVNVVLSASCSAAADSCNNVTSTASAKGKSFSISTRICNFN